MKLSTFAKTFAVIAGFIATQAVSAQTHGHKSAKPKPVAYTTTTFSQLAAQDAKKHKQSGVQTNTAQQQVQQQQAQQVTQAPQNTDTAKPVRVPIARQLWNDFQKEHPDAHRDPKVRGQDVYMTTPNFIEITTMHQFESKGKNNEPDTLFLIGTNKESKIASNNANFTPADSTQGAFYTAAFVKGKTDKEYRAENQVSSYYGFWDENMFPSGTTAWAVNFDYANRQVTMQMAAHRNFSGGKTLVIDQHGQKYVTPDTSAGRQINVMQLYEDNSKTAIKDIHRLKDKFQKDILNVLDRPTYADRGYSGLESILFDANDAANYGKTYDGLKFPRPEEKVPQLPPKFHQIIPDPVKPQAQSPSLVQPNNNSSAPKLKQ